MFIWGIICHSLLYFALLPIIQMNYSVLQPLVNNIKICNDMLCLSDVWFDCSWCVDESRVDGCTL